MTAIDPKKMALEIAGLRAAESSLPEDERLFFDPYAKFFFTEEERGQFDDLNRIRANIASYNKMMPGVNGAIASRIRFIDDYLQTCLTDGFGQVVIIGAGYDTRAYRIEGVKEHAAVFEVDHPATQEVKIEKIQEIFGALPDHVTYVPVAFGRDRLDEKLFASGYDPEAKTLFIIEGLLMYIPPKAVDGLLAFITGASAPGSALVADYFHMEVIEGKSDLKEANVLKQFVENAGSRLMFGLPPDTESDFFTRRGFHPSEFFSAQACKSLYFSGARADRTVSPMFNFVTAVVAPK